MADKGSNAEKIVKSVFQIAIDLIRNSKKNKVTWGDLAGKSTKK